MVAISPGSRADIPPPHPGAIRSMMFSPEPWDLLIWAEDQGRICIGDLRTGLKRKQVVNLDPREDGLRRIVLEDIPSDSDSASAFAGTQTRDIDDLEADFIRRYRQAPDNSAAVNFATEYIEARRRQRQQRQDLASLRSQVGASTTGQRLRSLQSDDDPHGLTVREQQILESLRTTRQREEARSRGEVPRSVNYATPDMFTTSNRTASSSSTTVESTPASARPLSEILSSEAVPDSFPELSRTQAASPRPGSSHGRDNVLPLPHLQQLQDAAWAQRSATSGLVRLSDGSRLPRRRQSVVLSPPTTNPSSATTSTSPSQLQTTAQRSAGDGEQREDEDNPWRTIEEHMTLARGPLFERAQQTASPLPAIASTSALPTEQELQAELAAERARARSLARQRERWRSLRAEGATALPTGGTSASTTENMRRLANFPEGYEALMRRSQARGFGGRDVGVRTAGLAMSADGRTLWAACEDGIFEIEMDLKGRMYWPSVEPR